MNLRRIKWVVWKRVRRIRLVDSLSGGSWFSYVTICKENFKSWMRFKFPFYYFTFGFHQILNNIVIHFVILHKFEVLFGRKYVETITLFAHLKKLVHIGRSLSKNTLMLFFFLLFGHGGRGCICTEQVNEQFWTMSYRIQTWTKELPEWRRWSW